jgi:hypothetical protein
MVVGAWGPRPAYAYAKSYVVCFRGTVAPPGVVRAFDCVFRVRLWIVSYASESEYSSRLFAANRHAPVAWVSRYRPS